MKEFNEIDELFGNAFADFQQTPPDSIKSAIDEKLFSSNADSKKKRGYGYFGLGFLMMLAFIAVNMSVRFELKAENSSSFTSSLNNFEKIEDQLDRPSNPNEKQNINKVGKGKSDTQETTISKRSNDHRQSTNANLKSQDQPTYKANRRKKNVHHTNSEGNELDKYNKKIPESVELKKFEELSDNSEKGSNVTIFTNNDSKFESESATVDQMSNDPDSLMLTAETSEENDARPEENELPTLPRNTKLGNSFQLYGGGAYAQNTLRNAPSSSSLKSVGPTLEFGGEFNFGLNSRLSLTTGFGIQSSKETYSETFLTVDSTLITTIDTVFNPNTQQYDTIIVSSYDYTENESVNAQTIRVNSFELPIYANWMINKESNFEFSISGGMRLAFNQMKTLESNQLVSYATVNSFGLSVMLRPQFVYYFGKVGLGAYFRYATDIIPVTDYQGVQRSRQLFGGGILFRVGL
jgi:hypothetical protein